MLTNLEKVVDTPTLKQLREGGQNGVSPVYLSLQLFRARTLEIPQPSYRTTFSCLARVRDHTHFSLLFLDPLSSGIASPFNDNAIGVANVFEEGIIV